LTKVKSLTKHLIKASQGSLFKLSDDNNLESAKIEEPYASTASKQSINAPKTLFKPQ